MAVLIIPAGFSTADYKTTMWNLKEFFEEEFFQTKKVVYVPL